MNQINRNKVENFLSYVSTEPLIFVDEDAEEVISEEKRKRLESLPLPKLIEEILTISKSRCSTTKNSYRIETDSYCYRTSLDIWRHANHFRPCTIFEIMQCLYNLSVMEGDLYTHYCGSIERRVFCNFESGDVFDDDEEDEYGLLLEDWKDI